MDPMSCSMLLGYGDGNVGSGTGRLYDIVTSWIRDKPPSKANWHNLIMEPFSLEYLTCLLHSTEGQFINVWTPYVRFTNSSVNSKQH